MAYFVDGAYIDPPIVDPFVRTCIQQPAELTFPLKKLFADFKCTKPLKKLDFSGWALPSAAFSLIATHTKFATDFNFEDTLNVTEDNLEALRGMYKLRRVNLKNAVSISDAVGRLIASWP